MKKPPKPIVEVIWDDAHSVDDWTDIQEIVEMGITGCRTIGYVVGETPELLCLANSIQYANKYGDINAAATMNIPKKLIRERRTLK